MKKIFVFLIFGITMFWFSLSAKALTSYKYEDWIVEDGYGGKEKITDNITNLKGIYDESMGMDIAPYSKKSKSKLKDGITEEVNVEIDFDKINTGELFEITLGLQNGANDYVSEAVVTTEKTSNEEVKLSAGWAPQFSYAIKESGIYTYRWEMFIKDKVTYVNFTILDYDKILATTGDINLDKIKTSDTKTPIANEKDVSVKYLWFCNIKVSDGINVYTILPEKNVTINPNTSDEIYGYFSLLIISLFFIYLLFKYKRYNQ